MKHGKKYVDSAKTIETAKLYEVDEAVSLVLDTAKAKFWKNDTLIGVILKAKKIK